MQTFRLTKDDLRSLRILCRHAHDQFIEAIGKPVYWFERDQSDALNRASADYYARLLEKLPTEKRTFICIIQDDLPSTEPSVPEE